MGKEAEEKEGYTIFDTQGWSFGVMVALGAVSCAGQSKRNVSTYTGAKNTIMHSFPAHIICALANSKYRGGDFQTEDEAKTTCG